MFSQKFMFIALLAIGMSHFVGCGGGSNSVPLPTYDAEGSASKAIELYDTDGDSLLSESELEAAPGIKAAMSKLDSNGDSMVSAEEITARIHGWETQQVGLMLIQCEAYLDGQPLKGAVITFEPEEIIADAVQAAIGKPGYSGTFSPKVPKENRPSPDSPPGIQLGFYRVKVSLEQGGEEMIPARYNTQTTLGQEIAKDDPKIASKRVIFDLKSK